MGRSGGASYRRDYSNTQLDHMERRNNTSSQRNGPSRSQGHSHVGHQLNNVNIYAAVDSWRAYTGDSHTSLQASTSPYLTAPAQGLNAAAPTFQPATYTGQDQYPSHFTQYQPLRISNGDQERQTLQNMIRDSRWAPAQHTYSLRPKPAPRVPAADYVLPYIETGPSTVPHVAPRPGLEALKDRACARTPQRTISPPHAPKATPQYLAQAQLDPVRSDKAKKLLIVLDLNGTLLHRPDRRKSANFIQRPGMSNLLKYLFANHVVMVFTSARPENADIMVNKMLPRAQRAQIAGVWARNKLGLSREQYNEKVQVYKKLDPIWRHEDIRKRCPDGGQWDQTNTILIDDSHLKALAQPYNLLQVPEFTPVGISHMSAAQKKQYNKQQKEILKSLTVKLEDLKWQEDVSRVIMRWQTGKLEIPKVPGSGLVVDEKVDLKEAVEAEEVMQMPTPKSPSSDESDGRLEFRTWDDNLFIRTQPVGKQSAEELKPGQIETKITNRKERVRSESPIPENIWCELLEPQNRDTRIRTPESLEYSPPPV